MNPDARLRNALAPVDPPDGFAQRVRARVAREGAVMPAPARRRVPRWMAIAAMLAPSSPARWPIANTRAAARRSPRGPRSCSRCRSRAVNSTPRTARWCAPSLRPRWLLRTPAIQGRKDARDASVDRDLWNGGRPGHRGKPGPGPATATARPGATERGCRRRRRRLGGSGPARPCGVVHVQRHRRQGGQGADLVAQGHLREELHVRQGRRLRSGRARLGAPPAVGRAVVAPAGRQVGRRGHATRRSICGATATSRVAWRCCRPVRAR